MGRTWTESEAFQVADDLKDVTSSEKMLENQLVKMPKFSPSAVNEFGVDGAINRLQDILSGAIALNSSLSR